MKYSFVIPCYGSELTLNGVVEEICSTMNERPELDYEIITVNDCSPDNVMSVIRRLTAENHRIKAVDLARNGGKHAAIMAGYSVAKGDIIINLDDDGQCPLDRLWRLLAPLGEGWDISIAGYPSKKESLFKRFGSKVNSIMSSVLVGKPKSLKISNFFALKRFVMVEMLRYDKPFPYVDGLLLRSSARICNVDMEERERAAGTGNYSFSKSLKLWLNGFTAFSVKPLRIATVMGFIVAFIGFVVGVFTVINKLVNPLIEAGYSSTMAVMLFIGGMIMLMLGMIGEYIGRIYICINNSPQYVVREVINVEEKEYQNE